MTAPSDLVIEIHGAEDLDGLREPLLERYRDAYADKLDDPFDSEARVWTRFRSFARRNGFVLAVAYLDGVLVGYALGNTEPVDSDWAVGLLTEIEPEILFEDGCRTFGLNYIMVGHAWRRHHIAKALHDAVLERRTEERALLYVLPDNTAARSAYEAWGWYKIGEVQPGEDAPIYYIMVLDLRPGN